MEDDEITEPKELGAAAPGQPDGPKVLDLLNQGIEDLKRDFVPILLAGLGLVVVTAPLYVLVFVGVFAAVIPGFLDDDPNLILAGYGGALLVGVPLLTVVPVPFQAALFRSVHAYVERGEPLGFGAAFRRPGRDLGSLVGFVLVSFVLSFLGVLACYVGVLVVMLFLDLAFPALVLHRLGVFGAIGRSFGHARRHLVWHLGFFGLVFALSMIAGNVPIIGYAVGTPFIYAFQIRAYRAWFPEPTEA